MAKIFWVEDQFHWVDKFQKILTSADFGDGDTPNQIEVHKFVESAMQAINRKKQIPDLAILDANMNGNDNAGLSISKRLNERWPNLPIIYLSEHSGTQVEQKAFEQTNAQDFIAKHQPNIEQVLEWRIKALLRHRQMQLGDQVQSEDTIVSGDLKIDLTTWNVYWHDERLMNPNNIQRPLAPTPRKILRYLVEAAPSPLTTDQMAEKLESEKFNYANYRQHIKTLRHSFEQACRQRQLPSFLEQTKNGKGIVTFGDEGAYVWIK